MLTPAWEALLCTSVLCGQNPCACLSADDISTDLGAMLYTPNEMEGEFSSEMEEVLSSLSLSPEEKP